MPSAVHSPCPDGSNQGLLAGVSQNREQCTIVLQAGLMANECDGLATMMTAQLHTNTQTQLHVFK